MPLANFKSKAVGGDPDGAVVPKLTYESPPFAVIIKLLRNSFSANVTVVFAAFAVIPATFTFMLNKLKLLIVWFALAAYITCLLPNAAWTRRHCPPSLPLHVGYLIEVDQRRPP